MAIHLDQYEQRLEIVNAILDLMPDQPISFAMEPLRSAQNWVLFYNPTEPYERDLPTESAWSFVTIHFGRSNVLLIDRSSIISREVRNYPIDGLSKYQVAADIKELLLAKLNKRLAKKVNPVVDDFKD